MSKVSVFKFRLNPNVDESEIKGIIENYLASRGFFYAKETDSYITGLPSKEEISKLTLLSIGASLAASTLTGGTTVAITKVNFGFEYRIIGNELVIKAYLLTKAGKSFIHSTFNNSMQAKNYYNDLRKNLFKALNDIQVVQIGKEVEKINDGSEMRIVKAFIIYVVVLVACVALLFFYFMNK